VTCFYLENYLIKVLQRHLKYRDPEWRVQYGDPQSHGQHRWIDNLDVAQAFPSPGRLTLRGQVWWVVGQSEWYSDPCEFELQLCPLTGAFQGYVYRFGDHRPLAAKKGPINDETFPPVVGGWQHEIHHGLPVE
jgi:hypothetical protein